VYENTRISKDYSRRDLIKWDRELEKYLRGGIEKKFQQTAIVEANYRPFVSRHIYRDRHLIGMNYLNDQIWKSSDVNRAIALMGDSTGKPYFTFAINQIPDLNFVSPASGGTQQLPRYRYTASGERVDNITDWALKEFHKAYGRDGRGTPAKDGEGGEARSLPLEGRVAAKRPGGVADEALDADSGAADGRTDPTPGLRPDPPLKGEGKAALRPLTKDDIFSYVYAVLHDPVYREKYALNLKREFPRIPFYPDFWKWAAWGEALLALHIGYEAVEPWPIVRTDTPDEKARAAGVTPKALLRADRDNGIIRLDTETTLSGIPAAAWDYRLGNRSGLDWILDQYREKTPKDPTIREKFNTYRFADYKEKVADLLARVARVSVETVAITEAMKEARR